MLPSSYKEANLCPIHKKDERYLVNNYRVISLLNAEVKVFERLIFKHLFNHLQENSFQTSLQSGCIPGDSTVNQLTYLYNIFCQALDANKEIRVVFCDISKAFDRVWHAGLLRKLEAAGFTGKLLNWFKNYLLDRRQRVILPGVNSDWSKIFAGVPQGSILGPLLFLVFINDIVNKLGSCTRLFADDTSLFIIVDDPVALAERLNADQNKILQWAKTWLVTINPNTSESLIISRKINKPLHASLYMNDQQGLEVDCHKHMGVYLLNNGSWHQQINFILERAWCRINIMRKLKFKLD